MGKLNFTTYGLIFHYRGRAIPAIQVVLEPVSKILPYDSDNTILTWYAGDDTKSNIGGGDQYYHHRTMGGNTAHTAAKVGVYTPYYIRVRCNKTTRVRLPVAPRRIPGSRLDYRISPPEQH